MVFIIISENDLFYLLALLTSSLTKQGMYLLLGQRLCFRLSKSSQLRLILLFIFLHEVSYISSVILDLFEFVMNFYTRGSIYPGRYCFFFLKSYIICSKNNISNLHTYLQTPTFSNTKFKYPL